LIGSLTVASVNDGTDFTDGTDGIRVGVGVGVLIAWTVLCGISGNDCDGASSIDGSTFSTTCTTPRTWPTKAGSGEIGRASNVRPIDDTSAVTSTVPWSR
jgi:hypothetical protein